MKKITLTIVAILFFCNQFIIAQWEECNNGLSNLFTWSIVINENNIFTGTWGGGIFLSTDNGNSWKQKNNGITNLNILSISISSSNNIYIGTKEGGIFLSSDNGESWIQRNKGLSGLIINSLVICGDSLFAGTEKGIFFLKEFDNSWKQIYKGININDNIDMSSLAVSKNKIVAGTFGGEIALSTNSGWNWIQKDIGLKDKSIGVGSIVIDGDNIFLGSLGSGMYLSANNGNSFNKIENGYPNSIFWRIVKHGNNYFSSIYGNGFYISNDSCKIWLPKNNGLSSLYIRAIAIGENNIFVATWDGGIFRAKISDLITDISGNNSDAKGMNLQVIDLNDIIRFEFKSDFENYDFKIYNLLGNIVFSKNESASFSNNIIEIDRNNFSTGIYLCNIKSGNHSETKKFAIMR
jgi:hypothetical protein